MSREIKYDDITRPFEMENGTFSLVNLDYSMCLLSIPPGVRGKVAYAIFSSIISPVYREKDEDTLKKGSLWSDSLSIDTIVSLIEPQQKNQKTYVSTRNNYMVYVSELIKNNIFYRFGKNNQYCYFYEKNILSWGYLWSTPYYIYPATIKKVLSSVRDLWDFYWHVLTKEGKDDFTVNEFYDLFASMVSVMIEKSSPALKQKVRLFDNRKERATLYLKHVSQQLSTLPDLYGFEGWQGFQLERIPMSVQSKFDEIIPEEARDGSKGYKPAFSKINRSALYRVRNKILASYTSVRSLLDSSLNVQENPYHLMFYLEKSIKEFKGIHDEEIVLYKNISAEVEACKRLYDQLHNECVKSDIFIREWIRWFVRENLDDQYTKNTIMIVQLMKTLRRFKSISIKSENEALYSSIYDDIDKMYRTSITPVDICKKYGFYLCYNFILVKSGKMIADAEMESMLCSIEQEDEVSRRNTLYSIMSATVFRDNYIGFVEEDNNVNAKYVSMLIENSCLPSDHNKNWKAQDAEHAAFWKRIKYEHEQRRKD